MRTMRTLALRVRGREAMWSIPHHKADPYTYPSMTPSAGQAGIVRSIYWKPEVEVEVDRIHVMAPIVYDTFKVRALREKKLALPLDGKAPDRTLQTHTILCDVDYIIEFRLVLNPHRPQRDIETYYQEFCRRAEAGQEFSQPYLGQREYWASSWELVDEIPPAIPVDLNIGPMLFNLIPTDLHKDRFDPIFFQARLIQGVLHVPRRLHDLHRDQIMAARHKAHPVRGQHA